MKNSNLHHNIALTLLFGFGPRKTKKLLSKLAESEQFFVENPRSLSKLLGIPKKYIEQSQREWALERALEELSFIDKHQIKVYFWNDENYPRRLKQCADAPVVLYGKGNMDLNFTRIVSVVGTRSATPYGQRLCEELAEQFVGQNILVVSGLAYGIDITMHQLCVRKGIPTVAVLGHGLDKIYPSSHRKIAAEMLNNGGLLTEFITQTQPDRENFPMRNRIVAGLSDATIVVESKISGGSLITADLAFDYNRDVFAFPGNVHQVYSEGCNQLIASDKAHLLFSAQDFSKKMNWNHKRVDSAQTTFFPDLSMDEVPIFNFISSNKAVHSDVISVKLNIPVSKVNILLLQLQLKGVIQALPGNRYELIC